ncbi:uncharacterized protein Dvir_GJ25582 [Drosophila virilis]|uniref:EGF-like domain-containing protein n=1 Tax=Drosophila virilis TaxID=7244 RepID=A0A0Q9WX05_DROVI|nr:uncharacterized protein LOC26530352 [Drosophila virilis]KRF85451.1 uncharacterized protein Dvir_GJ25582 [Drosophila virilis]
MDVALKRLRLTSKGVVTLAISLIALQQVAGGEVPRGSRKNNCELPYPKHKEFAISRNTFLENDIRLMYPSSYEKRYNPTYSGPSISRPSSLNRNVYRKGCIRRNGACDNRPSDCCFSSSCRCNLWGSNCRCQRMGLFQKWG